MPKNVSQYLQRHNAHKKAKNPLTDQSQQELTALGAVPQQTGGAGEPILTLQKVYGSAGAAKVLAIQEAGQEAYSSTYGARQSLLRRVPELQKYNQAT